MAMKQARALNALGLIFSAVFAAATSWCSVVHADDAYPRRPISLVVPWSPGGNADVMARIVAEKLGPELGTTVVIENRPGGNGIVGTDYVAKAKPDGYTLTFYGFSTHVLAGEMFTNVPFNTLRDFEAVSLVSTSPLILMTQPATGYKTINDLVAAAKAAPGKLNYAHFGIGTVSQLAAEEFQKQTGTKMTAVPYTSTKSILTDMIGGTVRIDMFFDSIPSSLPFARSNQLVALGVSSLKSGRSGNGHTDGCLGVARLSVRCVCRHRRSEGDPSCDRRQASKSDRQCHETGRRSSAPCSPRGRTPEFDAGGVHRDAGGESQGDEGASERHGNRASAAMTSRSDLPTGDRVHFERSQEPYAPNVAGHR